MLIYIASSFRNPLLTPVFTAVTKAGHALYDWRAGDSTPGKLFAESYDNPADYVADLNAPAAVRKFDADLAALDTCDALILLLPAGADAHAEAAYAHGRGTPVLVFLHGQFRPGLMHQFFDGFVADIPGLLASLSRIEPRDAAATGDVRSRPLSQHANTEVSDHG
jgi:hypothetical protein